MDFEVHRDPLIKAIRDAGIPTSKRIIIFYNNPWEERFRRYPIGRSKTLGNVEYVELSLDRSDHFTLDGHTNQKGHRKMSKQLYELLRNTPKH